MVTLIFFITFHSLSHHRIMVNNFRHFNRCVIILTLAALSVGFGGKVTLCFTTDGDVHVEQGRSLCSLNGGCLATADGSALSNDRIEDPDHCRDVFLGGDAFNHHQRNIVHPPSLALVPLVSPIILAQTDKKSSYTAPAVTPHQLVSLQNVILLI